MGIRYETQSVEFQHIYVIMGHNIKKESIMQNRDPRGDILHLWHKGRKRRRFRGQTIEAQPRSTQTKVK